MRYGWIAALLLAAPALLSLGWPALDGLLELDRAAVADGEWWRLIGAHWSHWSFDHLAWDVSAFVLLAATAWRASRRRTIVALSMSVTAISAAVWWLLPSIERYRGLSGLDSALFVLVAANLMRRERADGSRTVALLALAALAGFMGKIGFEVLSGSTLFASGTGYIPVPLAHLVGGICGLTAALVPTGISATRRLPTACCTARSGSGSCGTC